MGSFITPLIIEFHKVITFLKLYAFSNESFVLLYIEKVKHFAWGGMNNEEHKKYKTMKQKKVSQIVTLNSKFDN